MVTGRDLSQKDQVYKDPTVYMSGLGIMFVGQSLSWLVSLVAGETND